MKDLFHSNSAQQPTCPLTSTPAPTSGSGGSGNGTTICSRGTTRSCSYTNDCRGQKDGTLCEFGINGCGRDLSGNNVYICKSGKWVYEHWTRNGSCNFCGDNNKKPKPTPPKHHRCDNDANDPTYCKNRNIAQAAIDTTSDFFYDTWNAITSFTQGLFGVKSHITPCLSPTPPVTNTPTPTQVPSPTAPSGTKQTITSYGWGGSAAYQPAGSPWWALNNAWGGPPPNTQAIDYYPNNFPNNSTLRWTYGGSGGNVLGYPEIIIGDQNGQSIRSPNGVEPAWYGKTLGSLSHLILSWDIVINAQNGDNWDILFENHMMGNETGIFLKDPGWARGGTHFSNLGGISGVGIPNNWASGSFAIVPDAVLAGTPMLKGSIDLLPIFKWAISNGWMSSNESVYGWEFGVEPTNGSGSVTFNSLSVDIQ